MTDERLAQIKALCEKATPGPWRWMEDVFRQRYAVKTRTGKYRAKPGRSIRDTWIGLLLGAPDGFVQEQIKKNGIEATVASGMVDEYDFKGIFRLRWSDIRGECFSGMPRHEDCAFIAEARTIVPELIAEVERLRELLENPFGNEKDGKDSK